SGAEYQTVLGRHLVCGMSRDHPLSLCWHPSIRSASSLLIPPIKSCLRLMLFVPCNLSERLEDPFDASLNPLGALLRSSADICVPHVCPGRYICLFRTTRTPCLR